MLPTYNLYAKANWNLTGPRLTKIDFLLTTFLKVVVRVTKLPTNSCHFSFH